MARLQEAISDEDITLRGDILGRCLGDTDAKLGMRGKHAWLKSGVMTTCMPSYAIKYVQLFEALRGNMGEMMPICKFKCDLGELKSAVSAISVLSKTQVDQHGTLNVSVEADGFFHIGAIGNELGEGTAAITTTESEGTFAAKLSARYLTSTISNLTENAELSWQQLSIQAHEWNFFMADDEATRHIIMPRV